MSLIRGFSGVTHLSTDGRFGRFATDWTAGMAIPTVFAQVMSIGHREDFRRCVERYGGDAHIKSFSCHDQWLAMAFAQLTHRERLRDLESALGSRTELLYQMGFRGRVQRSTLADANEQRDWRIYADWA